uniref:beta-mannosidase n=1 Tax=Tetradesmus obliquus TaxID=3088 RepID=A0A383W609_TETOB|eukprot:jgi/Sobl393_1/3338/SZX72454.1
MAAEMARTDMMLLLVLALAAFGATNAKTVISLGSQTWTVENGNRSISASTTLPAYPLEILREQGIIEDPLYRFGELATRWVALDTWSFSLSFDGSSLAMQQLRSQKQVLLKLGGVDTFASVMLNGKEILEANNFHRQWSVPVKQLLVDGDNTLVITIKPAAAESERLQAEHPYSIPALRQMGAVGAYTFVRKPASDLGWDWGPAYAASGIHGGIELLGFSNAVLGGSFMSQAKRGDTFEVTITSELLVPPGGDSGQLTVSIPALNLQDKQAVDLDTAKTASFVSTFKVNASDVELWWPLGYGSPSLYNVSIKYTPDSPACGAAGKVQQQQQQQPGRRGVSRPERAQQQQVAATSADGAFRILSGVDLPGALTFKKMNTDSLAACQKWCQETAACQFYTFGPGPDAFCWLKRAPKLAGAIFGVRLDNGKYDLTEGVTLNGFNLGRAKNTSSVQACQAHCSSTENCKMFVLNAGKCQLKEPWAGAVTRLLGVKLSTAAASAAAAPRRRNNQRQQQQQQAAGIAPAAVPSLDALSVAADASRSSNSAAETLGTSNTPGAYSMSVTSPTGYAMGDASVTPGAYAMIVTDSTPGAYALSAGVITPGGYAMGITSVTPGGYTVGDTAAAMEAEAKDLDEFMNEVNEIINSDMPMTEEPADITGDAEDVVAACAAAASSQLSHRIGFRTVELVRLPIAEAVKDLFPAGHKGWDVESSFGVNKTNWDGSWAMTRTGRWDHFPKSSDNSNIEGESFYFKVNGVPIYMKGANLVPLHILPTNVSKAAIHELMQYALQSNMNMIRIWGGGLYPVDDLFKFTDENGLLVWMETMFACAPYPRDPDFLQNVATEVTQQVHRASWHPSVGVWAGNNEIEGSLSWYSESRTNKQLFAGDYIALFVDTIRSIIKKDQPSMAFVDSSPSNGAIVDDERQFVKRWGEDWDPRYGDVHHYAYDADCEDYSTYPKAKFISEFGSQSYPTFATYAEYTAPSDWQVDNYMTGFRNRRFANGLEVLETQFKRHFRLPATWSAPNDPEEAYKLFRSFFYITHMQQARCYEAAINYWRRLRSQPAGLTMGVLYWQLNDIAAFASWSGYDYEGRWKPLAYAVKRMYANLQVQAIQDGPQTKIFLVNDHTTAVNTSVEVSVLSLSDSADAAECAVQQQQPAALFTVPVAPLFAEMVWTMPTEDLLATRKGCTKTTCYISVTASGKASPSAAEETSVAQLFLVPLKDINLPDPELQLSEFRPLRPSQNSAEPADSDSADSPAAVTFTLKSNRPAVLTNLNTKIKGRFSDDAFTALHPCQPRSITFYPHASVEQLTAAQLKADLAAESLFDHQYGMAGQ